VRTSKLVKLGLNYLSSHKTTWDIWFLVHEKLKKKKHFLLYIQLRYGLDDRGFESRQELGVFLFAPASRPALGPIQFPTQWVPGAHSLGVKLLVREADNSPPSSAEVECVELYLHSSISSSWRGAQLKHRDNFTFTHICIVKKCVCLCVHVRAKSSASLIKQVSQLTSPVTNSTRLWPWKHDDSCQATTCISVRYAQQFHSHRKRLWLLQQFSVLISTIKINHTLGKAEKENKKNFAYLNIIFIFNFLHCHHFLRADLIFISFQGRWFRGIWEC